MRSPPLYLMSLLRCVGKTGICRGHAKAGVRRFLNVCSGRRATHTACRMQVGVASNEPIYTQTGSLERWISQPCNLSQGVNVSLNLFAIDGDGDRRPAIPLAFERIQPLPVVWKIQRRTPGSRRLGHRARDQESPSPSPSRRPRAARKSCQTARSLQVRQVGYC